jgi:hypothetical protein
LKIKIAKWGTPKNIFKKTNKNPFKPFLWLIKNEISKNK